MGVSAPFDDEAPLASLLPPDADRSVTGAVESAVRTAGRRLCEVDPRLNDALVRLWGYYVRLYPAMANGTAWRRIAAPAPIDPFRVVEVDPDDVEYMVEDGAMPRQARDREVFPKPRFKYAGAVIDGDWDRSRRRFEDSELYRSFEAHFERGVAWTDTPFFATALDHVEDGTALWGCSSRAELIDRCRELDALYAAIDRHGYRSQRNLVDADVEDPVDGDDTRPYHVRLVNDELAVCVGREGELLFYDGRDRLAIAKLLDLDSIPVWLLVRHRRWQRLRNAIARDPTFFDRLPDRLRSHPDVRPERGWIRRRSGPDRGD